MTHDLVIRSKEFADESRQRMETALARSRQTMYRIQLSHERSASSSFVVSSYTASTVMQESTS